METKHLNQIAEEATQRFLERSSITYLECAVSLMLTHCSKARVVEILKQQTRMVQEFD